MLAGTLAPSQLFAETREVGIAGHVAVEEAAATGAVQRARGGDTSGHASGAEAEAWSVILEELVHGVTGVEDAAVQGFGETFAVGIEKGAATNEKA